MQIKFMMNVFWFDDKRPKSSDAVCTSNQSKFDDTCVIQVVGFKGDPWLSNSKGLSYLSFDTDTESTSNPMSTE